MQDYLFYREADIRHETPFTLCASKLSQSLGVSVTSAAKILEPLWMTLRKHGYSDSQLCEIVTQQVLEVQPPLQHLRYNPNPRYLHHV